MINKLIFILLLYTSLGQSQSLEDAIYARLDAFVENTSPKALQELKANAIDFTKNAQNPNEYLALVVLYANMGFYDKQYGNFQPAIRSYEKAWEIYKSHQFESYDIIEYTLKPLGNIYTQLGDFANAERVIKRYIALAKSQNDSQQQVAGIINLSVVYHNTGKHSTAIELLQEGLETHDLTPEQVTALENNMATNLLAKQQLDKAKSFLETTNKNNVLKLRNKAQLAMKEGEYEQALRLLNQVELQLINETSIARDVARFYVEKASVFVALQAVEKASDTYLKALKVLLPLESPVLLPPKELLYAEPTFISIFDGLAKLQASSKIALAYYDLSFYVSDLMYADYTQQEVRLMHQSRWKRRTERCLDILWDDYQTSQNSELLKRAFTYVENSKARVLREQMTQQYLLKLHPEDSLLQLRKTLTNSQEQLINLSLKVQLTQPNAKRIAAISDSLSQIHQALRQVQGRVEAKYSDSLSTSVSLGQIQQKLRQDQSTLLLYFSGRSHIYRFDIDDKSLHLHRISKDSVIKQQLSDFIGFFESPTAINRGIADYRETAYALYQKLMPEARTANANLMIIPDALLHFVPFEALLFDASQSTVYEQMPFLLKRHTISYNNSAHLYNQAESQDVKNSVLGLFPVFEDTSKHLSYSLEESKHLEELMPTTLLLHDEASSTNFKSLAAEHSILHLSTHAYSGTFTIPATMEFYDDVLLVQDLYSLQLNPKLVVLSACETGVGKLLTGEGPISLARGFQYAGAQNLLFSLWEVNDRSTSQLMASFYKHYSHNQSAAIANRKSKLDFLENKEISNANKSPYYWSAFVYYGAVEEAKEQPKAFWVYIVISLMLVVGVFQIYTKRIKKKV